MVTVSFTSFFAGVLYRPNDHSWLSGPLYIGIGGQRGDKPVYTVVCLGLVSFKNVYRRIFIDVYFYLWL